MLDKTLQESQNLSEHWVPWGCLAIYLFSWTALAFGAYKLHQTNTYALFENYTKTQSQETSLPENPEGLETLLPTPTKPKSTEEYQKRKKNINQKIQLLQKDLNLPRTAKLEFLLGTAVKTGKLHPLEALNIQQEHIELSQFKPQETKR
jgi:hypothetical protein